MKYTTTLEIPVAWGDMDAFGHVNNVMYIRYFETGRVKYFDELEGYNWSDDNIKPVLVQLTCDYKKSVVYPDTLTLHVGIKSVGNTSFVMACEMHSPKVGLAAIAEATIVMVNFDRQKPVRIPSKLREFLQPIQPNKNK